MAEMNVAQQAKTATVEEMDGSLLDQILSQTKLAPSDDGYDVAKKGVAAFISELLKPTRADSQVNSAAIDQMIAELDRKLSAQVDQILHNEEFKTLESAWRSLKFIVDRTDFRQNIKIEMMNVSKDDLLTDFEDSPEIVKSGLYKHIYTAEYGQFGGQPVGAVVCNYAFGPGSQDVKLAQHCASVGAMAHAPIIAGAAPEMFGVDNFEEIPNLKDMESIFEGPKYTKWKSFRESEDSRYVGLTLPHILLRLPYGPETVPVEAFNFKEDVDGKDHSKYLWGNASYAFATRLTEAFAKYSWCAAIRGVEGGGLVEGLPTHTFMTDDGEVALKCPTEIAITDRREKELSDLGFIPLVHCKGTDYAAFFGAQSSQKAKKYDTDSANANARLSTQLQYILATSRFAHYLKAIMRDKIGSFMTRQNCQDYLNRWITNYVLLDDNASQAAKAQYPLREARIDVSEVRGKPGVYRAVAFLKPHFQLDELTVSLRLVAELPTPVAK